MVKEYIDALVKENNEKLDSLDKQMKGLLNDLDCAKKWLDSLHVEENTDTNIFSPRVKDAELEKRTEEAQNNIEKIQQDIDHIGSLIEENTKKKLEFERLLDEIDHMELDMGMDSLSKLLSDLYQKTELCLSCLYTDRVKCKNELKNMKSMIQNMKNLLSESSSS